MPNPDDRDETDPEITPDERAQVNFTVDRSAKNVAMDKTEHGEMSEKLRQTVHAIAFGDEIAERQQLERELDDVRDQQRALRAEKRELETQLESLRDRESQLEQAISNKATREDEYEGMLKMLEELLYDGMNVSPKSPKVQRAAETGGREPEGVVEDLMDRNPGVPVYAFQERLASRDARDWEGCTEAEARDTDTTFGRDIGDGGDQ